MWFKNLQVYQFTDEFDCSAERLEKELANARFFPCASITPLSTGWVSPVGQSDDAPLVHMANGFILLALKIEEKIMPASVVREQLAERVKTIEAEHQRKVSAREKNSLKDDIYSSLLPRAFTKSHEITAYIDPMKKLLVINAVSKVKAENFASFLRKTLGSLPVAFPETASAGYIMTQWLKTRKLPQDFHIEDSCVLWDKKSIGSMVRCTNHDIMSQNVQNFVKDGMEVAQLKLRWRDHLTFHLKEDFSVTSLKFSDAIQDSLKDIDPDDAAQKLDASFYLMTETLREFLSELLEIFKKR